MTLREKAEHILQASGLLEHLKAYGTPHIIGSLRMDMMAWNDIDIDIENDGMDLEKLYRLTRFVMDAFHPVWYEAREEADGEGKTVWFQGFEAMIDGEKCNFDRWFFDRDTIEKDETLCDGIAARATPAQRESITEMKRGLLARGLYSFEKFCSMDVYRAVLEENIQTIEGFLERHAPGKGTI